MPQADYVIVGSGLTGATIARALADAGREVLILERRSHVGGNVHDHTHASGIRIHTYGPHYFRTNSERIWAFATRFASFYRYEPALKSMVDGELVNWPIAGSYIRRVIGASWEPAFKGEPSNFEEAALSMMPRMIYEKFVKEYNEKQWGVPAKTLSADLCKRFDVRHDDEPRLKPDCRYQGIPEKGYAYWMGQMLAGIPVILNFDYLSRRDEVKYRHRLVFTGPIDAFFDYDEGKLFYRGQIRKHSYYPDVDFLQPCGQVNAPMHYQGSHLRTLEWKHMMPPEIASGIRGTLLTTETPFTPKDSMDYEYPFPDSANAQRYQKYKRRVEVLPGVTCCGRLGDYQYYDMDQAIARAMTVARQLGALKHS